MSAATSAAWTILARATSAGSPFNPYLSIRLSNEHRPPTCPNSTPGTSYGAAPSRSAVAITSSAGTNRNSASGSMNRRISQGQATRSTLASPRVTHFIGTPVSFVGWMYGRGSGTALIDPDLWVLLLRPLGPSGHREVELTVRRVEDRCPGAFDSGYRCKRLVPI